MGETSLEVWAVATFDVVALGLVGVLAGHLSGGLGDALRGVGTVSGVLVFGYLWALVLVSMRWVLADGGLVRGEEERRSLGRLLARGVVGSTLVGMAFVGGLGLVAGVVGLGSGVSPVSVLLVTFFGALGGAVGGALLGAVFGLVDVALARGADALLDRATSG